MSNQKHKQPRDKMEDEIPHNHARRPKLGMSHTDDVKTGMAIRGATVLNTEDTQKKTPKLYK